MMNASWLARWSAACSTAGVLALSGCGGGGTDSTPAVTIRSLTSVGDSLADSGTFGFKFTVQGADSLVYPERLARTYGVPPLCNYFVATSATTFVPNPAAGCTNFAVGAAVINNPLAPASPLSIPQQLRDAAMRGDYGPNDLLVVDGGGNDAAALVGAFLHAAAPPRGDGGAAYVGLLGSLLPPATVGAAAAQGRAGLEAVGQTYMTALADSLQTVVQSAALDHGAQRVVVLNMPGITKTPRFQMVLDGIAAAAGGGDAGAAERSRQEQVFNGWIVAYNTELAARFAGNPRVIVVDFYASFLEQITHPERFGLQNVRTPACPITGVDADGLPTYTFPTCTDASLSATPPPDGATGGANWWQTFGFSDSFHPTPFTQDLLARYVSRALAGAGWL